MDIYLEEVARQIDLIMRQNLAAELIAVASEYVNLDAAYFAAIGAASVPDTTLKAPAQWFLGHHPTVLDRPLEEFPNVTVMCYRLRASRTGGADQVEAQGNLAYVEAFANADDEATANRIAWRYAKAMHRVITKNKTLGGLAMPMDASPDVDVSNVTARRVSPNTNDITYIQGARLEYTFEVNVKRD